MSDGGGGGRARPLGRCGRGSKRAGGLLKERQKAAAGNPVLPKCIVPLMQLGTPSAALLP